jgi:hypothetical protein
MIKKDKKKSAFDKLSAAHKKFFVEYTKYLNAKYAYKITHPKCKDSTAESQGPEIVRKHQFQEALKEYYDDLWEKKDDYIGKTLKRLVDILDFDITDFLDENGYIDFEKVKEANNSFPIAEVARKENNTKYGRNIQESIKTVDKLKAISELTKILQMIKEKVEIDLNIDKESAKEIQEIFNEQVISQENNR